MPRFANASVRFGCKQRQLSSPLKRLPILTRCALVLANAHYSKKLYHDFSEQSLPSGDTEKDCQGPCKSKCWERCRSAGTSIEARKPPSLLLTIALSLFTDCYRFSWITRNSFKSELSVKFDLIEVQLTSLSRLMANAARKSRSAGEKKIAARDIRKVTMVKHAARKNQSEH